MAQGGRGVWRKLIFPLKLVVAGGLCYLLLRQGQLDLAVMGRMVVAPSLALLGVVGVVVVTMLLCAVRWWLLMQCQGIDFPLGKTIQVFFIGTVFNTFLPGGFGGDAVRMMYAVRAAPRKRTAAVLSVFVDRLVGLVGLMVLALVGLVLNFELLLSSPPLRLVGMGGVGVMVVLGVGIGVMWMLLRRHAWRLRVAVPEHEGRWHRLWRKGVEAAEMYHNASGHLARAMGVTLVIHTLTMTAVVWLAVVMGITSLGVKEFLLVSPWSWLANALPIAPGGLGVGEAAFSQLAQWAAGPEVNEPFGTVFFVLRVLSLLAALPGVVFYLLYKHEVSDMVAAAQEEGAG